MYFTYEILYTFVENCDRQTDRPTDRPTKLGTEAPSPELKNSLFIREDLRIVLYPWLFKI